MSYTETLKFNRKGINYLFNDAVNAVNNIIKEAKKSRRESKKKNLDITFSFSDLSEPKKDLLLMTIKKIKYMKEDDVLFLLNKLNQNEGEY